MTSLKKHYRYTGLATFIITAIVFFLTAERTGSLWDVGEFILGAYKLQVVHPPGAPLFLLIGRLFTWVAELISDDPSDIAFAVNFMSGLCTAGAAAFTGVTVMIFGKLAMVGRGGTVSSDQAMALSLGGLVAGLTAAFATSVWFSAVEGEVYAMSTFFTALTFWAAVKWYELPNERDSDRWLIFSLFCVGLSIGVHLLSLLTLPAIALLYYFKKYEKNTLLGSIISMGIGVIIIGFVQKVVIAGIPGLWKTLEITMVNSLGLPKHSGLIPTVIILTLLAYFLLKLAREKGYYLLHILTIASILITIGFSTIGTVVIRANADTPINMNVPSDATRLLPYLNREQYGERPLLLGPTYNIGSPQKVNKEPRYGYVNGKYEIVDEKYSYEYASKDKILFPRVGHSEGSRPKLHNMWRDKLYGHHRGAPSMGYNMRFFFEYQLKWMYWRYFAWNFIGRQNGEQGYYPWDLASGHWASGIKFIDEMMLYNMDELPQVMKEDKSNNTYYFIPFILGLLGMIYHFSKSKKEFFSLLILFLITGIGIIIYSNQPPNEPRERDYVFVGSFVAFAMWVGMGTYFLFDIFKNKFDLKGAVPVALAGIIALSAPIIMGFKNFDDHDRSSHYASRDYASNFLNSVDENAIIFTYGDNDTYPLWYAQEVEGIRRDVRVVNLSLIAVDWYIEKLRNKVNDSPPINLTLDEEDYRGKKRNQVFFYNPDNPNDQVINNPMPLKRALSIIGDNANTQQGQTIIDSKRFFIPINKDRVATSEVFEEIDTARVVNKIEINFSQDQRYITKDDLAILDIIGSNFYDRPIYFATTSINSKLLGLNDYMKLEGLALKIVPTKIKSDPSLGIYGSGTIDLDKTYDRIMNKWRWGNFDKEDVYVNSNYLAAVQSMKMAMMRLAASYSAIGNDERAANVVNKYFEAFPHMNFPYDGGILPFLNILISSKDYESAKKHIEILATTSVEYMDFYQSLDSDDFQSFQRDMSYRFSAIKEIEKLSKQVNDPAFAAKINDMINPYLQLEKLGQ